MHATVLAQSKPTMPQGLPLAIETANSAERVIMNMAAVCVTGQDVLQVKVVP